MREAKKSKELWYIPYAFSASTAIYLFIEATTSTAGISKKGFNINDGDLGIAYTSICWTVGGFATIASIIFATNILRNPEPKRSFARPVNKPDDGYGSFTDYPNKNKTKKHKSQTDSIALNILSAGFGGTIGIMGYLSFLMLRSFAINFEGIQPEGLAKIAINVALTVTLVAGIMLTTYIKDNYNAKSCISDCWAALAHPFKSCCPGKQEEKIGDIEESFNPRF